MSSIQAVTPDAIAQLSAGEMQRALRRRWSVRATVLVGWGVFIGLWYLFAEVVFNDPRLPAPHLVLRKAGLLISEGSFGGHLWSSLSRLIIGFLLAVVLSAALGLLISYSEWWKNLLQSMLQLIVGIPTIGFAVLALVLFGVLPAGQVLTTMLVATPYITMNLAQGISGVDRKLIVMSEAYGRTRNQIIRDILLPSALLSLTSGARLAFAVAWRMELLSEIFAASRGVGVQIRSSFERYDTQGMLAWTLLFVAVMLIFEHLVLRQIERLTAHWRTAAGWDKN